MKLDYKYAGKWLDKLKNADKTCQEEKEENYKN